jgi:hypothetical protein
VAVRPRVVAAAIADVVGAAVSSQNADRHNHAPLGRSPSSHRARNRRSACPPKTYPGNGVTLPIDGSVASKCPITRSNMRNGKRPLPPMRATPARSLPDWIDGGWRT